MGSYPTKPSASARCPVCRGPGGADRMTIRRVGSTTTYGVPLVASVSVTNYQQGVLSGICPKCTWWVTKNRVVSWLLRLVPAGVVLGLAAAKENALLGMIGGVLLMLVYFGVFYS